MTEVLHFPGSPMRPYPPAGGAASGRWVEVRCPACNKKLCDRSRDALVTLTEVPDLDHAPARGTITKCRCGRLFQLVVVREAIA